MAFHVYAPDPGNPPLLSIIAYASGSMSEVKYDVHITIEEDGKTIGLIL